jgi:ABC-type lipoprotein release transport system permease subunit
VDGSSPRQHPSGTKLQEIQSPPFTLGDGRSLARLLSEKVCAANALAVNRLIASLLFGVRPTDTVTIALVIATIMAVAVVASWLPAWRASRVDPNIVLRDE